MIYSADLEREALIQFLGNPNHYRFVMKRVVRTQFCRSI